MSSMQSGFQEPFKEGQPVEHPPRCPVCGGREFNRRIVLWDDLVEAWDLNSEEASYIERQQGLRCSRCDSSLRSMALADAFLHGTGFGGTLQEYSVDPLSNKCRIVEINEAGALTQFLRSTPDHRLLSYPDADMLSLPLEDSCADVVLHSDTLEHVPDPLVGLKECRRILKAGGICYFTVPTVVDRLTRSRAGLPASYHGRPGRPRPDFKVQTEFGCDVWKWVIEAGFKEYRLFAYEYPAALVHGAVK